MSAVVDSTVRGEHAPALARHPALRLFASDLFGYGLVSAAALALDWGLLLGLVRSGLNYQVAAAMSFTCGMLVAYAGSILLIFRCRRQRNLVTEAVVFFAIGFAGLALNQALLFAFVHFFSLHVGIAKAPTVAFVFTFNFFLRRRLLFTTASIKPAAN